MYRDLVRQGNEAGVARDRDHLGGAGNRIDAHDEDHVGQDLVPRLGRIGPQQQHVDPIGAVPAVLGHVDGLLTAARFGEGIRRHEAAAEHLAQGLVEIRDHDAHPGVHGDAEHDEDRDPRDREAALMRIRDRAAEPRMRDGEGAPAQEREVSRDDCEQEAAGEKAVAHRAAEPVPDGQHRKDQRDDRCAEDGRQHPVAGVRLPESGKEKREECRQPRPRLARLVIGTIRSFDHQGQRSVSPGRCGAAVLTPVHNWGSTGGLVRLRHPRRVPILARPV